MRGFRIELGEIEAALLAHPAVRRRRGGRRATTRAGDSGWSPTSSPAEAGAPAAGELRACLRRTAARAHGALGASWSLAALPLTPNGKVDRRALPAPDAGAAGRGRPGRAAHARRGAAGRHLGRGAGAGARRACTTTSSRSAATRCSPPRWSRACATRSASSCRCAPSSRRRPWRASPGASRRSAPPRATSLRRSGGLRATGRCRSPSPRSGSGSSTSSSRAAPAYNMPAALRLRGAARPARARGAPRRARAPPRGAAHHLRGRTAASPSR